MSGDVKLIKFTTSFREGEDAAAVGAAGGVVFREGDLRAASGAVDGVGGGGEGAVLDRKSVV